MEFTSDYPFNHHPCYTSQREELWSRIHLPVAPFCNVKCAFCDHKVGSACHSSKPGFSSKLMTVAEALHVLELELEKTDSLKIVAVSGPGEPLANPETLELLRSVRSRYKSLKLCISTNGTLLSTSLGALKELRIDTISVSMSAISPKTAAAIYEWAVIDQKRTSGVAMGSTVINLQLEGIRMAAEAGITVKVNTILIPTLNRQEMKNLSLSISQAGAMLQNIIPLIPNDKMADLRSPSRDEVREVREMCAQYISQFTHCKQCRSDVVGIPGNDRVL